MSTFYRWQSGTAAFLALGITAGTVTPLLAPAPSFAQTRFSDVQSNYWAADFIQELSQRGVIAGFPDGTFRPDEGVTRAQFAAMIRKAFQKPKKRDAIRFVDVSSTYWAFTAIQEAYTTGFMAGYPGGRFEPEQNIPRQQVLTSLANGLEYTASGNVETILQQYYSDGNQIAGFARSPIAAATEKRMVVNYPNVKFLQPTQIATRAQVAAFIYQALVSTNQATAINSPYIVVAQPAPPQETNVTIPSGTAIPVKYDRAQRILVTKDETAPLTLTVSQDIVTPRGTVVIPAGSEIVGELKPAQGGSQFVARQLVLTNGQRYNISATSEVITKTEQIRKGTSASAIIKDAALGAAAAAAVAAVTGDRAIATEEVLGGVGIGALIGLFFGRQTVDLIVINPNTDLQLTFNSDLQIPVRN
jgi:hypothetical protein